MQTKPQPPSLFYLPDLLFKVLPIYLLSSVPFPSSINIKHKKMQASIYLPSSAPLLSIKTSTFSNTLFPAKQRIKTSSTCISIKAARSDAPGVDYSSSSVGLLQTDCKDVAMVTLDSMQRANSTLEDFCKSYFMFHEMDANSAESVFKYLPLLSFTESYMYQLDTINEKLAQVRVGGTSDFAFRKLADCLEGYGVLTDRIKNELKSGEEYWALERKLCGALTRKEKIRIEDVMKASHLRSFDYRVLDLLVYQLTGKEVNEEHMEFLSASEFLAEIFEDFADYEDDVLNNTYNVMRMFVRIYGPSSAPIMLEKSITEAEEKYRYLLSKLDPKLAHQYQKRREEAKKEGYKWIKSGVKELGSPFGTWSMPTIIEDEELYRYEISNTKPPGTS